MSNSISSLYKTISCLPVVGPAVSFYNALSTVSKLNPSLTGQISYRQLDRAVERESLLNQQRTARRERIALLSQAISYNSYGIASHLFTAAGIIGALALGILSAQILAPCLIGCGIGIIFHAILLSGHNQAINSEKGLVLSQELLAL